MSLRDVIFDAGIDCSDELNCKMLNSLVNARKALLCGRPVTAKKYLYEFKMLRKKAGEILSELDNNQKSSLKGGDRN